MISERARGWLGTAALFGTGRAALFEGFAPPNSALTGQLGEVTPQIAFAALAVAGGAVVTARFAIDDRLRRGMAGAAAVTAVPLLIQALVALPNPYLVLGFAVAVVGLVGLAVALWEPAHTVKPWPRVKPDEAANTWGLIASVPLFFLIVVASSPDASDIGPALRPFAVALAVVAFVFAATITLLAYNANRRPRLREGIAGPAIAGGIAFGLAAVLPLGGEQALRMVGMMLCAGAVGMIGLGLSLRRYRVSA